MEMAVRVSLGVPREDEEERRRGEGAKHVDNGCFNGPERTALRLLILCLLTEPSRLSTVSRELGRLQSLPRYMVRKRPTVSMSLLSPSHTHTLL